MVKIEEKFIWSDLKLWSNTTVFGFETTLDNMQITILIRYKKSKIICS